MNSTEQPKAIKVPVMFNMEHFRKFACVYNSLIIQEKPRHREVQYYNPQGSVAILALCDYTEQEQQYVLNSWDLFSDDFRDMQSIFDVIKGSNFTQPFSKNMMRHINKVYKRLLSEAVVMNVELEPLYRNIKGK